MSTFGEQLRHRRQARDVSLRDFARLVHYDVGYLSRIETGAKPPTEQLARVCDDALDARGELIATAHLDIAASRDNQPWQTAELIGRIQKSDASTTTLEALNSTVFELCCEYPFRDADSLRTEAHGWFRRIGTMLHKPTGLHAHQELLTSTGWLALLVGCLEYDMGMRTAAEVTRAAAQTLGEETDHPEIIAWTHEMAAWFALTQGRYKDVIAASQAAQHNARNHSVVVQLIAQEAKAIARIRHDTDDSTIRENTELRRVLEHGQVLLNDFPVPKRTDHHFIVDPAKWNFYAMDAYRLAREDQLANEHANEVIRTGTGPDGSELAPMRMAESRLTLAVVAARNNDLEQAVSSGLTALASERRSLPSLMMVAGELDSELERRFPDETLTAEFRDALRTLR
jgi:transcriptional regulator with XRE-family HTH domain